MSIVGIPGHREPPMRGLAAVALVVVFAGITLVRTAEAQERNSASLRIGYLDSRQAGRLASMAALL